MACE
jgi:hypothetical protein